MINLLKNVAFSGGEWVIYILIACSIFALAVVIEKIRTLNRERKELKLVREYFVNLSHADAKLDLIKIDKELRSFRGLSGRVVGTSLAHLEKGAGAVEEYSDSILSEEKRRLDRRMIILGTLGNNAVYIGLFGTVLGVIKAFHDLAMESGAGPEVVMQGLSEALIATAAGLMVALPCVIAFNVFHKMISDLVSETESMVSLILAQIKAQK